MFEDYRRRMEAMGDNIRESIKQQSTAISESLFVNSTSYKDVIINGKHYDAKFITDSKTTVRGGNGNYVIEFRSNFNPPAGTYVRIPDNQGNLVVWLIHYKSDNPLYPKHIIKKCNYLLRWKNRYGKIIERWGVLSDNNRLTNGDSSVQYGKMTLPWQTSSIILPYDNETINLRRDKRLLIDDPSVIDAPDAYIITNRNINTKSFGSNDGVIELALSQHQYNPQTDNRHLMVADYYITSEESPALPDYDNLICKIEYTGTSDLKMGAPFKTYTARFYQDSKEVPDVEAVWSINILEKNIDYFTYEINGNAVDIKCKYDPSLIGSHFKLSAADIENTCSAERVVEVVSMV